MFSLVRNAVWFAYGYKEFTKAGYLRNSKKFKADDLAVDMSSKVAIVTGGNKGLGKQVVIALAEKGATVFVLCRDLASGNALKSEIYQNIKNANVIINQVDVSKPKELSNFVNEFKAQNDHLDILINNAGVLLPNGNRPMTSDNIETTFATNTLSGYYLTRELWPLLEKSNDGRVINVSSGGMYTAKLDNDYTFENIIPFDGTVAYSKTKRQQVELTNWWAKKFAESNVRVYSMHPGWADTPGVQSSIPKFHELMKGNLRSEAEGADSIVWLAVSESVKKNIPNGSFVFGTNQKKAVTQHLTMANTQSKSSDVDDLVAFCNSKLETL